MPNVTIFSWLVVRSVVDQSIMQTPGAPFGLLGLVFFPTCETAAASVALETTGGSAIPPAPITPPSRPKAPKCGAPGTERGSRPAPGRGSRSRLEEDNSRVRGGGEMEEGRGGGGGGGGGGPPWDEDPSRRHDSVSIWKES